MKTLFKTKINNLTKPAKKILVILLISAWIFSGYPQIGNFPFGVKEVMANSPETYDGSNTWTVPPDVCEVTVEVWGAGGGGGTAVGNDAGSGGGGGAYSSSVLSVLPNEQYSITVGTGGTAGNPGGDSYFATSTVLAKGGGGGGVGATVGAGGQAVDGVGTVTNSGGDGGPGETTGGPATRVGGGGGGSATSLADGGNGGTPDAGTGEGNGGAGSAENVNGGEGNAPGGGGGGSGRNATGGAGADGRVVLTYTKVSGCGEDPVLSAPTGSATGTSTASGSVSTNQANGTLYFVVTESATSPTETQVKEGRDHTGNFATHSSSQGVTATGTQNVSAIELTLDTTYYFHFMHENSNEMQSNVSTSNSFTTNAETSAPTLSSPTGSATGTSTASGSVTTDQDNGNLYWVITESITSPTEAQVKEGQDHTGASAVATGTQSVTLTGVQSVSATGLTADTTYYFHFMHENSDNQQSNVSTSNSFITDDIKLDPRLIQDSFRVYENRDNQTPLIALSDENNRALNITQNEAIRFRINTRIEDGPLEAGGLSVELQYALLEGESGCSGVASSSYSTVGDIGSVAIWRGFSNPSVTSGTTLNDLLLSNSNVAGSYEEQNPSVVNPNEVGVGERLEWDFVAQNNNAQSDEVYCFRLTEVGGEVFFGYESYAEVKVIRGLVQVRYRWRNDDGTE